MGSSHAGLMHPRTGILYLSLPVPRRVLFPGMAFMTGRHDSKGRSPDGQGTPSCWTAFATAPTRGAPRGLGWFLSAAVALGACDSPAPPPDAAAPGDDAGTADARDDVEEAGAVAAEPLALPPDPAPDEEQPDSGVDWRKYPLPELCLTRRTDCKTPKGEPGLRCGDDPICFNPCPPGKGMELGSLYCGRRCKTSAECSGGTCSENGVCDRWPKLDEECEGSRDVCTQPNGHTGVTCNGKCVNPCKKGLFLQGGTHCVKQCRTDADCGGRGCNTIDGWPYFCGGLCPSSCPYRYE